MDDVYDTYYADIVDSGYDVVPYQEWSDELSACYKEWSEASSAIYRNWSQANSNIYRLWSSVSSGFYRKNFDIDAIVKEMEEKEAESQAAASADSMAENKQISDSKGSEKDRQEVDPELVAFLDEYEAFMDEYVEFMKTYKNAEDATSMLSDYVELMGQFAEYAEALEQYDPDEMSTADAVYLLEVTTRVSQKMLEVAY